MSFSGLKSKFSARIWSCGTSKNVYWWFLGPKLPPRHRQIAQNVRFIGLKDLREKYEVGAIVPHERGTKLFISDS